MNNSEISLQLQIFIQNWSLIKNIETRNKIDGNPIILKNSTIEVINEAAANRRPVNYFPLNINKTAAQRVERTV